MAANDQGGDREVDYLEFAINDNARLVLSQGDITKWDGDALVNAGVWDHLHLSCFSV